MIASLTGRLVRIDGQQLVLDVQGVGYLIIISRRTADKLGEIGGTHTLLTELQVREDSMTLFGFADAEEQAAFNLVQTVQGVGAKAAIALLSALSPSDFHNAILAGDKAMVATADGIGPKLAQRIVNELAEKIGKLTPALSPASSGSSAAGQPAAVAGNSAVQDALSALTNLGYGRAEAFQALQQVQQADSEAAADVQGLISASLRVLAK
ncbi:MAG: Holliday junction branch migration protein RuvA [Candidatus Puniceispirillaceae bacterium]